jgi:hypothetical protein
MSSFMQPSRESPALNQFQVARLAPFEEDAVRHGLQLRDIEVLDFILA